MNRFWMALLMPLWIYAHSVTVEVSPSQSVINSGQKSTVYLKVNLHGEKLASQSQRTPLNVALVLDRSGSMMGEKMEQTKVAAKAFVDRLDSNDIVSIVTYDDKLEVLYPASKLTDRQKIKDKIDSINARGSTALYGGVQKGAQEIRKFISGDRVNRIILLSDGQANVGLSSPEALGELGKSLVQEGISVTTLGLGMGYNEDLMTKLAYLSDGNHKFLKNNEDIEYFFNKELGFIASVAAQHVEVTIGCDYGVTPIKMVDVDATIKGQTVKAGFNQIYGDHSRYMLLALEVDPKKMGDKGSVATVTIAYVDARTKEPKTLHQRVTLAVSADNTVVEKSHNREVEISVAEQEATITSVEVVKLRDTNRIVEAKKVLQKNIDRLEQQSATLQSPVLQKMVENNKADLKNLDTPKWSEQRKMMKDTQTKSFSKGCL